MVMRVLCPRDVEVTRVTPYALFVKVMPGVEGIMHAPDVDVTHTSDLRLWSAGDTMDVKVMEVGKEGTKRGVM